MLLDSLDKILWEFKSILIVDCVEYNLNLYTDDIKELFIIRISMKSDKDKIQKYVQFYLPKEILSTKYTV